MFVSTVRLWAKDCFSGNRVGSVVRLGGGRSAQYDEVCNCSAGEDQNWMSGERPYSLIQYGEREWKERFGSNNLQESLRYQLLKLIQFSLVPFAGVTNEL
jgi:hypothetical protein